jgi:hypothetical protein
MLGINLVLLTNLDDRSSQRHVIFFLEQN